MKGDKGMADRRGDDGTARDVSSYEEQLEQLLSQAETPGGASEQMIAEAESELGIRFPPSYRRFLSQYGAVVGEGFEIAGLFPPGSPESPPLWNCVLVSNNQLRKACREHLPTTSIRVSDDGMDDKYYLDLAVSQEDNECAVVVLGPGYDNIRIADSFAEFAVQLASSQLDYYAS